MTLRQSEENISLIMNCDKVYNETLALNDLKVGWLAFSIFPLSDIYCRFCWPCSAFPLSSKITGANSGGELY